MGDTRLEVERLAPWAPLPEDDNDWTECDLERYTADAFAVKGLFAIEGVTGWRM